MRHVLDVVEGRSAVCRVKGLVLLVVQRADVVRFPKIVPRDDLHVVRPAIVQTQDLLPPVVPQIVALPDPVLAVPRQVGVEPRRDGHHVGLARERVVVRGICVRCHLLLALGPGVPAEQAVGDAVGERNGRVRADRRPVRHEEALGGCLDLGPVAGAADAFEGGHQGLRAALEVFGLGAVGRNHGLDCGLGPRTVAGVVEGEEELETLLLGGAEGERQLGVVGRVVVGHVQSERIDAGGFGRVDLGGPVVQGEGLGVAHLLRNGWSVMIKESG